MTTIVVDMNKARNCTCATCEKEYRFPPCKGFVSSPFKKHSCATCFHLPEEHIAVVEKVKVAQKKRATNFVEEIEGSANEINEFLGLQSDGSSLAVKGPTVSYADSRPGDDAAGGAGGSAKISKEAQLASDFNTLSDYFHFDVGEHITLYDGVARRNKLLIRKLTEIEMDKIYYLPSGNTLQLKSGSSPKLFLSKTKEIDLPAEVVEELPKNKAPPERAADEGPRAGPASSRRLSPRREKKKEPAAEMDPFAFNHPDRVKRRKDRRDHTKEVLEDSRRTMLAPPVDPLAAKLSLVQKGREARKKKREKKTRMY